LIAHRGASAKATEHTFAAYDLALEMGADMLEVDLRLTADGQLVVVHDRTLLRTVGDERRVSDLRLCDIWEIESPLRPLGLHEIFARYGSQTSYLLDLKAPAPPMEQRVAKAIAHHGLRDRVMVQAFSRRGLQRMRRCDARVSLAQLYSRHTPAALIRDDLQRVASFAEAIAPEAGSVNAALVAAAHGLGLRVQPWTVNEPGVISRMLHSGVDGLITDVPDVARALIELNQTLAEPSAGKPAAA
jgi:glycerophosphoryl diester phosphodiesterase